jgi:hypothetical protein
LDAQDVRGLLGLLLADGSLMPYRTPSGGHIQLTLTAGAHESAFLEEKVAELRQFIATQARIIPYQTTPRANGKTTTMLRFRLSSTRLRPVHNLLYPRGVRRITSTVLELLGAPAAAWLWAEGARPQRDGSVQLARVGADRDQAQLVAQWLATLSGASSSLDTRHIRPRLIFQPEQVAKLAPALALYAPVSRRHLFTSAPMPWDVSTLRSARTELRHGGGAAEPARQQEPALSGAAATRD